MACNSESSTKPLQLKQSTDKKGNDEARGEKGPGPRLALDLTRNVLCGARMERRGVSEHPDCSSVQPPGTVRGIGPQCRLVRCFSGCERHVPPRLAGLSGAVLLGEATHVGRHELPFFPLTGLPPAALGLRKTQQCRGQGVVPPDIHFCLGTVETVCLHTPRTSVQATPGRWSNPHLLGKLANCA